jgi:hypothetical protein
MPRTPKNIYEVRICYTEKPLDERPMKDSRAPPEVTGWEYYGVLQKGTQSEEVYSGSPKPWDTMYEYINYYDYLAKKNYIESNFRVELWEFPYEDYSNNVSDCGKLLRFYAAVVIPDPLEEEEEGPEKFQSEWEGTYQDERREEDIAEENSQLLKATDDKNSDVEDDDAESENFAETCTMWLSRLGLMLIFVAVSYVIFRELEKANLIPQQYLIMGAFLYVIAGGLIITEIIS